MQQTPGINSSRDVPARRRGDGECRCVSSVNRTISTFLDFVVIPAASTAAVVAFLQLSHEMTADKPGLCPEASSLLHVRPSVRSVLLASNGGSDLSPAALG